MGNKFLKYLKGNSPYYSRIDIKDKIEWLEETLANLDEQTVDNDHVVDCSESEDSATENIEGTLICAIILNNFKIALYLLQKYFVKLLKYLINIT